MPLFSFKTIALKMESTLMFFSSLHQLDYCLNWNISRSRPDKNQQLQMNSNLTDIQTTAMNLGNIQTKTHPDLAKEIC